MIPIGAVTFMVEQLQSEGDACIYRRYLIIIVGRVIGEVEKGGRNGDLVRQKGE